MGGSGVGQQDLGSDEAGGGSGDGTAVLARVSQVLAGSLNVDHLTRRLLDLLVPDLIAFAQLTLADRPGSHRVAYTSVATEKLARDSAVAWTTWHLPTGHARSVDAVMTSGRRAVHHSVSADLLHLLISPPGRKHVQSLVPGPALVLPLAAGGAVIGTLTLLPGDERATTEAQIGRWERVADRAALALHSALMYQDRRHALDVLQADLHPPALPSIAGLDVAAFYRAADASGGLGGDFYDVHGGEGDWTVVLGDVSGKGVEAAVLAGHARQSVRTAALVDRRPGAMLDLLNRVMVSSADADGEQFLTVACARFRHRRGGWAVDLASAGHPTPLLLRSDGRMEPVAVSGALVGLLPGVTFDEARINLADGDTLLLFTDGVTESRDAAGEQFGPERVARLLGDMAGAEAEAVVAHLSRSALEWRASAVQDDIALLALRAAAGGVRP